MCSNNPSFLASDEFYAGTLHILTALEIPTHLFGAYIIVARTPTKMQSVKTNMFILHVVGALVDVFLSFLVTPVLILPFSSGYPLGISLTLGIPTSVMAYIGLSSVACKKDLFRLALVKFMNSSDWRNHRSVFRRPILSTCKCTRIDGKRSWQRNLYAVVHYLFCSTFIAPAFCNIPEETMEKVAIKQINPCMPDEILNRPGYIILSVDNTITCICILVILSLIVVQFLFFVFSIFRFLFRKNSTRSAATIRLQKQFFKAMCLQVVIPLVFITFPSVYIVAAMGSNYYNQAATNIAAVAFAFHGILSTLIMLIVHTPYRKATLEILRISRNPTNQSLWRGAIISHVQPNSL